MKTMFRFLTKLLLLLWILCTLAPHQLNSYQRTQPYPGLGLSEKDHWCGVIARPRVHDQRARQILDATGVKGGLIVHIGCGDGKLTAGLLR